MANVLSLSQTTGTPVAVPASGSPATLISYQASENNYQAIEVKTTIILVTTGSSVGQDISFEFKLAGVTKETILKHNYAVIADTVLHLNFMERFNGKGAITLTMKGLVGADATSTATVQNTYILGHY